ncbi:type II toxin-antitoxin system RatA family toxin [Parvularcula sp. LCG005]|uniref:type II toxin-antitoxin system RatA family toxin n=1 Tax=Parvularcula sp. LCG005 TaxID=3078805 RepID=UPI00294281C7|nr:type II toxin-antitoxin system RatA family toxin [Parvularcula sp. LCG005]WOI54804.1 type II toxin-antitoxin system RatA family toxin [Parvularcula sp. LCG005]
MRSHHERTIVPFEPGEMFDLVANVEDYPRFIPWVEALRVREREGTREEGVVTADMVVGFKMFRESFRSRVTLNKPDGTIDVDYVRGPLKTLINRWRFEPHAEGCVIDFCIEFEFRNMLMQTLANQLIDKAFKKLSQAFVEEAHRQYTPKHIEKRQHPS